MAIPTVPTVPSAPAVPTPPIPSRCLEAPKLPLVQLPNPLSLTPPGFPNIDININILFCCKLPPLPPIHVPNIPIPPLVLTLAIIKTLNGYIKQATDFVNNSLHLDCPLELK